eukprot:2695777-Lingulodinium_polyedra.AAC.1
MNNTPALQARRCATWRKDLTWWLANSVPVPGRPPSCEGLAAACTKGTRWLRRMDCTALAGMQPKPISLWSSQLRAALPGLGKNASSALIH